MNKLQNIYDGQVFLMDIRSYGTISIVQIILKRNLLFSIMHRIFTKKQFLILDAITAKIVPNPKCLVQPRRLQEQVG